MDTPEPCEKAPVAYPAGPEQFEYDISMLFKSLDGKFHRTAFVGKNSENFKPLWQIPEPRP